MGGSYNLEGWVSLGSVNFIVVDTETGGVDPYTDALLSIGARRVSYISSKRLLSVKPEGFSCYVMPEEGLRINDSALLVNQIEMSTVNDSGLTELDSLMKFYSFCASFRRTREFPVLLGWNVDFDVSFLKQISKRTGNPWPFKSWFDISHYWRDMKIFGECESIFRGITEAANVLLGESVVHEALADVDITIKLLGKLKGLSVVFEGEELS